MNLIGVTQEALGTIQNHRLRNLYQKDFIAWQADVLGYRTYKKMEEIANTALFGSIPRTAIKSSNGTSKSFTVASMIGWVGSVYELGESVSIITAPSISQIDRVLFAYLKANKARAAQRGRDLPGWINEQLEWQVRGPEGQISLAFGRKPATGTEVSTFQGVRSQFGKTFVFGDEAGGLSKKMYTAAEAVLTGADARLVFIGNPDDVGTEWQEVFENKKYDGEYNRFTLSSFDLPTFTGEVVYPDDDEMEERMLKSLTQVSWVEHKKRIWGEEDARYLSKVLGEFPKDGGNGFFSTRAVNTASDTQIPEDKSVLPIFGVDVARWGQDESVIASNYNGRIRIEDTWGQTDLLTSARRIHRKAMELGCRELRIDAGGVGGGVFDMLDGLEEFSDKQYVLVGWDNGTASPDLAKWSNKRAYAHDSLRQQMIEGYIDLDIEGDDELREQLTLITYKFTNRGGIQITPKDDMKTEMGGSPDRLDAVIMAGADLSPWTGNPINMLAPGERVVMDTAEVMWDVDYSYGSRGMPM